MIKDKEKDWEATCNKAMVSARMELDAKRVLQNMNDGDDMRVKVFAGDWYVELDNEDCNNLSSKIEALLRATAELGKKTRKEQVELLVKLCEDTEAKK